MNNVSAQTSATTSTRNFLPEVPLTQTEQQVWDVVKTSFDYIPVGTKRNLLNSVGNLLTGDTNERNNHTIAMRRLFGFAFDRQFQAYKIAMNCLGIENPLEPIQTGSFDSCRLLMDFFAATERGDVNAMDGLMDNHAFEMTEITQAFKVAKDNGQYHSAELLIDRCEGIEAYLLLSEAFEEDPDSEFLRTLIFETISRKDCSLLHHAVKGNNVAFVKFLIEGFTTHDKTPTPLFGVLINALETQRSEIADLLLSIAEHHVVASRVMPGLALGACKESDVMKLLKPLTIARMKIVDQDNLLTEACRCKFYTVVKHLLCNHVKPSDTVLGLAENDKKLGKLIKNYAVRDYDDDSSSK